MAKNKALSWALSLIIHATGLAMILVAGFHLAAKEGVVTDKVEFEAVGNQTPMAQSPINAPNPAEPENKSPTQSQPEKSQLAPPSQVQNEEVPAEKIVDEAPPVDENSEAPPAPEAVANNSDPTTDSATPPSEAQNENPNPTPSAPMSPMAESPNPGSSPIQGDGQGSGATIDESKLSEAFGNHKPSYPYMSRLRRQQGTVILRAFVNPAGDVNQVSISQSSGFSAIDEEARSTYERWRYKPGLTGWVLKPFKFSLK